MVTWHNFLLEHLICFEQMPKDAKFHYLHKTAHKIGSYHFTHLWLSPLITINHHIPINHRIPIGCNTFLQPSINDATTINKIIKTFSLACNWSVGLPAKGQANNVLWFNVAYLFPRATNFVDFWYFQFVSLKISENSMWCGLQTEEKTTIFLTNL